MGRDQRADTPGGLDKNPACKVFTLAWRLALNPVSYPRGLTRSTLKFDLGMPLCKYRGYEAIADGRLPCGFIPVIYRLPKHGVFGL